MENWRTSSEASKEGHHAEQSTSRRKTFSFNCSDDVLDLPENFEIGRAMDGGDCFFDSVAQGLKRLWPEVKFTVKSLRRVCKNHAVDNQELRGKVIQDSRNPHDLTVVLPESNISDRQLWDAYLTSIEYNSQDIERMQMKLPATYKLLTGLKYGSTLQAPLWGRPDIEGQIICKQYNIEMYIVEKLPSVGWSFQLISGSACKSVDDVNYRKENTIYVINRGKAHFEPILPQIQHSELQYFEEPSPKQEIKADPLSIDDRRMTYSTYRYIENLPHFCKEKHLWKVYVPKDSDCLFLAIILAYLVPVKDEDAKFKDRLNNLSGDNSSFDQVETLVKNYNPFLYMRHTYDDNALKSFTKLFRNRVIKHMKSSTNQRIFKSGMETKIQNVEEYLDTMSDPSTWGSEFEVMAISDLLDCNISSLPTGQLGTDELNNSSLITLVYDVNSAGQNKGSKHYNFYLSNDIGRYFEVYSRLNIFVKSFVEQFQAKLLDFQNQIKPGGKTKTEEPKVAGGLGQILGAIATSAVGLGLSGASMGKDAVSCTAGRVSNKKARDLAKKINDLLQQFQKDKSKFRETLINVGAEIFRNFENQFADRTDSRAMVKLAGDGVDRVVNYLDSEFNVPDGVKEMDFYTLTTTGIILGKSKGTWVSEMASPFKRMGASCVPKSGHTLKEGEGYWNTSDLYENTGLLIEENNVNKCYKKRGVESDKYGYRLPFEWELDKKVWLEQNYKLVSNASKKYVYIIKLGDELKQRLKDILNEFNRNDLELIPEKITDLVEGQKRVEKNVERGNEEISQLQAMHEMSRKTLKETQRMAEKGLEIAEINLEVSQGTSVQIEEVKQKTEELGGLVLTFHVLLESKLREIQIPMNDTDRTVQMVTELHDVASSDSEENVKGLLTQNVEVNAHTEDNHTTPLGIFLAAQNGSEQIIIDLLNAKNEYVNVTTRQGATPLHYAAKSGHIKIIEALFDKGAFVGVKTTDNFTALHLAAENGHGKIIKFLLDKGASVNEPNGEGATALHLAVHNNRADVVEVLLENTSIDVNVKTEQGVTPLYYAVQNNCLGIVEALLKEKKTDVNAKIKQGQASLHYAAIRGYEEIIRKLLLSGDVNVDIKDSDGLTPLHYAAYSGHVGAARILLEKGAAVDCMTPRGTTPLFVAVHCGQMATVDYLLKEGAQPNVIDVNGATALHYAAQGGYALIVDSLLSKQGVDVNMYDKYGFTPLHYAAKGGYREIIKSLLSKIGVTVNILDSNGLTPLHYAAGGGYHEIVRDLLKKRDHIKTPYQNLAPIHVAAAFGNKEVIDVLLATDCKGVNYQDDEGATPLHYAARMGRSEIVEALLINGADLNAKTADGTTPLQFAKFHNHEKVVQILTKIQESFNDVKVSDQRNPGCCLLGMADSEVPQISPDNASFSTAPEVTVPSSDQLCDQLMKRFQALMNEQTAQFSEQLKRVEDACMQLRQENAQLRGSY